jgi:hypothetical protein
MRSELETDVRKQRHDEANGRLFFFFFSNFKNAPKLFLLKTYEKSLRNLLQIVAKELLMQVSDEED